MATLIDLMSEHEKATSALSWDTVHNEVTDHNRDTGLNISQTGLTELFKLFFRLLIYLLLNLRLWICADLL